MRVVKPLPPIDGSLVYHTSIGSRLFFIVPLIICVGGLGGDLIFHPDRTSNIVPALLAIVMFGGLLFAAARMRLTISSTAIEWRNLISVQSVSREEFAGGYTRHHQRQSMYGVSGYFITLAKISGPSLTIDARLLNLDHRFDEWARGLTKPDPEEYIPPVQMMRNDD